jgi:hypothetical protein
MNSISEDEATIQGLTESGNIMEYAAATGLMAWEGVKIIIAVLIFVLGGFAEILIMLGIDSAITVPLQAGVDFLVLFELGQILFVKG